MTNEFLLIEHIKKKFHSEFIGDDCAVIPVSEQTSLIVSTDILIENIHFIINNNLNLIGKKTLICNISDVIAMGVEPKFFFLSLGVPEHFTQKEIDNFLSGLHNIAENYKLILAGGDISAASSLTLSVTIAGFGENDKIVYRKGAKEGDDIYITGVIGDSEIGLRILKKELDFRYHNTINKEYFIKRHFYRKLYPDFITFLSYKKLINSMIDISDGFLQDLGHILRLSEKNAQINEEQIPLSNEFIKLKKFLKDDFYKIPLYSGEEYELIFTASPENRKEILNISENFNVKLSIVGKITEEKETSNRIKLKHFQIDNFKSLGYKHF